MKCYFGGSSLQGLDHEFRSICFAQNLQQAKQLIWKYGDVHEDCDSEYIYLRVVRRPEHDDMFGKDGRKDAHVVTDRAIYREMGWSVECDEHCDGCGLATMDGDFPLCDECDMCAECGHEDDCPNVNQSETEAA